MDNLDNKTPIQPGENDLYAQCDILRHLVTSILILLVVISGTFNICLLRLFKTSKRELAGLQAQAAPLFADYQKSGPLMDDFLNKITEYGRTHADFAPIMAKYNLRPAGTAGALPATPASSPATMPKK